MSDVISITRQNISEIEPKCPYQMWEKIYRAVQANIEDHQYPLVKVATEIGAEYGVTQDEIFILMPSLRRFHEHQQRQQRAIAVEAAINADASKHETWGPPIATPANERTDVHPPTESQKAEDTATQPKEDTANATDPTA